MATELCKGPLLIPLSVILSVPTSTGLKPGPRVRTHSINTARNHRGEWGGPSCGGGEKRWQQGRKDEDGLGCPSAVR